MLSHFNRVALAASFALTAWIVPVAVVTCFVAASPVRAQNEQSPIDFTPTNTVFSSLPAIGFNYTGVALELENRNGGNAEGTVRATAPTGTPQATVSGETFNLLQFHLHIDCEHVRNGVRFPMELHAVHQSTLDNSLMVVGRWITEGAENAAFAEIFNNLPQNNGDTFSIADFDLSSLLPTNRSSFRYDGSLTQGASEPFTEGIDWVMFDEPLVLSATQIAAFGSLFPEGNSRPVQPLNGRVVLTDVAGFAVAVPESGSLALILPVLGALGSVIVRRRK